TGKPPSAIPTTASRRINNGSALANQFTTARARATPNNCPTTHAAGDPAGLEDRLVVLTGVRAALGGVVQADVRTATLQRHSKCADGQMSIVYGADGPAHVVA